MSAAHCPADSRRKLTPPAVAKMFGISPQKVISWIEAGELRAMNIATRLGSRPRYVVDLSALEEFEQARSVVTPPPKPQRRRTRSSAKIEFI